MQSSRLDLYIDIVVDWFIFQNNKITLSSSLAFIS